MVPILKPKCYQVKVNDIKLITRLANWYFEEWGIPKERTLSRLVNHLNDDALVQLVLKEGNRIIATGGLFNNTGLTLILPKYKALSPWIAQLYTDKPYRSKGYGSILLKMLEEYALKSGFTQVYLYTSTAERLYKRCGYVQMERLRYRDANTVVMEKNLGN